MDPIILLCGAAAALIMIIIPGLLVSLYRKCGPNEAMVITGGGHQPKIIMGGGCIVLPVAQKYDVISLEIISLPVKTAAPVITSSGAAVSVEGAARVKVRSDKVSMMAAAEHLLGKDEESIKQIVRETFLSKIRTALRKADRVEGDIEELALMVAASAEEELARMGLSVVSFTIEKLSTEAGDQPATPAEAAIEKTDGSEDDSTVEFREQPEKSDIESSWPVRAGGLAIATGSILAGGRGEIVCGLTESGRTLFVEARLEDGGSIVPANTPVLIVEWEKTSKGPVAIVRQWTG